MLDTDAQQFLEDIARNLEEWAPYTQRLPREKLQAALNKASLYLTRELSSAVNDYQRTGEE
jgi:hypothetical protein